MENEEIDRSSLTSLECNLKNECLPVIQFLLPTEEGSEIMEAVKEPKSLITEYYMKENYDFQEPNLVYDASEEAIRIERSKKNWTELYRKLDYTIAEIFDEVATMVESGIDPERNCQELKSDVIQNSICRRVQKYVDENYGNYASEDFVYPQELGSEDSSIYDKMQGENAVDPLAFSPKSEQKSWKKCVYNDQENGKRSRRSQLDTTSKKNKKMPSYESPKLYKCVFPNCTYSSNCKSNVNKHGKIHYKMKLSKIKKVKVSKNQKLPNSGKENETRIDTSLHRDDRTSPPLLTPENSDTESLDYENSDSFSKDVSAAAANQTFDFESRTKEYSKETKSTGNYRCPNCNYVTIYKFNLKRHIAKHSPKRLAHARKLNSKSLSHARASKTLLKNGLKVKLLMCSQCSYESCSRVCIKRHERADHISASEKQQKSMLSDTTNCFECDYLTPYKSNLWKHERRHRNFNKKNLLLCKASKKLKNETKRKLKNGKSVCEAETIMHATENSKERNIKTAAFSKVSSKRGKASGLSIRQRLKSKVKALQDDTVINSKRINLGIKSQKYLKLTNNKELVKSRIESDIIKVKMFQCVECQFVSRRKSQVQSHLMNHPKKGSILNLLRFKCPSCTFTSNYKFCVGRHLKIHPSSINEKAFKCSLCVYTSRRRYNVKIHEMRHEKWRST